MSGVVELNNGTANDLLQGNADLGALVTLSAAGANGNSGDLVNPSAKGIKVVVDITAISGTNATLTVTIKAKDTASGKYQTILASAGLTGTGTTVLTVYPGLTASTNLVASDHLPRTYQISYTITGTNPSVTATIGACLLF